MVDEIEQIWATSTQGGKADSALQPEAIGSSVQSYSENLDTLSRSAPGETGLTLLGLTARQALLDFLDLQASDISYNAFPLNGGVVRNAFDALADFISVKGFGAIGDGANDDTGAFQAALDYAAIVKGTVYIPTGRYKMTSLLSMPNGVSLIGAAISATEIVVDTPSFLEVTDGPNFSRTVVESFTVLPNQTPVEGSFGIKHNISNFSPARNSIAIRNIQFRGADNVIQSTKRFHKYIWTRNTYGGEARNIRVEGGYRVASNPEGQFVCYGMHISGQSVGWYADHCNFNAVHTHSVVDEITEGPFFNSCEAVGVRDGFDIRGKQPGAWIANCHVNSARTGIWCDNRLQVSISNTSLYRAKTFFPEEYNAIRAKEATGIEIAGLEVVNSILTGMSRAIYAESDNTGINVSSATLRDVVKGIEHGGGNNGCLYSGINFHSCDYPFTTGATDDNIRLGPHAIIGTTIARYIVAAQKRGISIDTGRLRYDRLIGNSTVGSAAVKTLNVGVDPQVQRFGFAAGNGPYYFCIDLLDDNALPGDFFKVWINLPSCPYPSILFRNGSYGPTLLTLNTTASKKYSCEFIYNGSDWVCQQACESLS